MCGINGFNFKDQRLIEMMVKKTHHRGPDDSGIFSDEKISLGHNRLSIIDLSQAGHQPMVSLDNNLVIIFNGEIYNFPEVKSCYLLSGTYDLLLIVEGEDIHTVASFVSEKLAPLSSVRGTATHFLLKKYKEDGVVLVKGEKNKRLAITY